MKRIMLLAAFAAMLSSVDANAQGKPGTQQPRAGSLNQTDNRAQPGTWRTTTADRDIRETPGANTREMRQVAAGSSVSGTIQDTTRRRRDTVRSPEPIPTPPVPPPPPLPRDTPRTK